MTVRELLDKQREWTLVIVGEEYDCGENVHANKSHPYIKELNRELIYDEHGDREVEYFYHFLTPDNRIVMSIQLEKIGN